MLIFLKKNHFSLAQKFFKQDEPTKKKKKKKELKMPKLLENHVKTNV